MLDLLATQSPIVIAGDDDQALYSLLRSSSPDRARMTARSIRLAGPLKKCDMVALVESLSMALLWESDPVPDRTGTQVS